MFRPNLKFIAFQRTPLQRRVRYQLFDVNAEPGALQLQGLVIPIAGRAPASYAGVVVAGSGPEFFSGMAK